MKLRWIVALLLAMAFASTASAQTLPGVEVFSPGLVRVSEKLGRGERVEMTAELRAEDMFYARDLSVLGAMLEGTTLAYEGVGTIAAGSDQMTLSRGGETLLSLGCVRTGQGAQAQVNGQAYTLDPAMLGGMQALDALDAMESTALLERIPLTSVLAALESVKPGDALLAGFAAQDAFALERTMSDDGERLTKIDLSGSVAREGGAPWAVTGYIRQPGGRSPKDTFEITFTQDEDNFIELTYSALYKSEVTRKNKAGEMGVDVSFKAAGKIAGSRFSGRLTVYLRNSWTADGETLKERVSVSATLGYTDHAPGRRMQRLNDLSVTLKGVTTLTTAEAGDGVIALSEDVSLKAVFDGNTYLDVSADAQVRVGGEGEPLAWTAEDAKLQAELAPALDDAAAKIAKALYAQLEDKAKKKIENGL